MAMCADAQGNFSHWKPIQLSGAASSASCASANGLTEVERQVSWTKHVERANLFQATREERDAQHQRELAGAPPMTMRQDAE